MVNNHDQQDIFSVLEKGKQWIENDTCNVTHCLKITQKCLIFLKLAKLTIFGIFDQLSLANWNETFSVIFKQRAL